MMLNVEGFSAVNGEGTTIYYNITDIGDKRVEVCFRGDYDYSNDEYSGKVNIPSAVAYNGENYLVTGIGEMVFYGCYYITLIAIPEGVTVIGERAFSQCLGLTSIAIPESVIEIGDRAFAGCSGLALITIPKGISEIGGYTFSNCSGLVSINIPEGVIEIGESTFSSCTALTSITIPEGITVIRGCTFYNCTGLMSIIIPKGVTMIGGSAFSFCRSLRSIIIPEGVVVIGDYAFDYCRGLISIMISSTIEIIGCCSFAHCSMVREMRVGAVVPPSIEARTFEDVMRSTPVYVPDGSVEDYKGHELWKEFNIKGVSEAPTSVDNVRGDELDFVVNGGAIVFEVEQMVSVYSVNGVCVFSGVAVSVEVPQVGVYVVVTATSQSKIVVSSF